MSGSRSTMKQKALLDFVDQFIAEHGYGPSYREIMRALDYKSVSTVAIHVDGLIEKGYLRKRDNSARSLEVVSTKYTPGKMRDDAPKGVTVAREKWMVSVIEEHFAAYRNAPSQQGLDELYVLVGALKVLGFEGAYVAMRDRLIDLTK